MSSENCILVMVKPAILTFSLCSSRLLDKALSGWSGCGVVDNTLDYQFRDRKIDPQLLRFFR